MKIFIPSYSRQESISTHKIFENHSVSNDIKIILHDNEQKKKYLKNPTMRPEWIIVSDQSHQISYQRQFIKDNLVDEDEWFIMMADNIKYFAGIHGDEYNADKLEFTYDEAWRKRYNQPSTAEETMFYFNDLLSRCKETGAYLGGFANHDNYFYKKTKWKKHSFVCGKAFIACNDKIEYDHNILTMDDYGYTAENLLTYGKVCVNNFVFPVAKHYQAGGIGTFKQRVNRKIIDCKYLMEKYPELFRYSVRKNSQEKAEIVVRLNKESQINKWRENMVTKILQNPYAWINEI